jgi:hypothetical protein
MCSGSVKWICETCQLGLLFNGENDASIFRQNLDELLSDYTALHPRRWQSSYSLQLEVPNVKKNICRNPGIGKRNMSYFYIIRQSKPHIILQMARTFQATFTEVISFVFATCIPFNGVQHKLSDYRHSTHREFKHGASYVPRHKSV